jgi:hypothetical protein
VGRHAVTARSQVSLLLARSLVVWVALFDSDMSIRLQFFFLGFSNFDHRGLAFGT